MGGSAPEPGRKRSTLPDLFVHRTPLPARRVLNLDVSGRSASLMPLLACSRPVALEAPGNDSSPTSVTGQCAASGMSVRRLPQLILP